MNYADNVNQSGHYGNQNSIFCKFFYRDRMYFRYTKTIYIYTNQSK